MLSSNLLEHCVCIHLTKLVVSLCWRMVCFHAQKRKKGRKNKVQHRLYAVWWCRHPGRTGEEVKIKMTLLCYRCTTKYWELAVICLFGLVEIVVVLVSALLLNPLIGTWTTSAKCEPLNVLRCSTFLPFFDAYIWGGCTDCAACSCAFCHIWGAERFLCKIPECAFSADAWIISSTYLSVPVA